MFANKIDRAPLQSYFGPRQDFHPTLPATSNRPEKGSAPSHLGAINC